MDRRTDAESGPRSGTEPAGNSEPSAHRRTGVCGTGDGRCGGYPESVALEPVGATRPLGVTGGLRAFHSPTHESAGARADAGINADSDTRAEAGIDTNSGAQPGTDTRGAGRGGRGSRGANSPEPA